jgi:hypothetical protein
MGRVSIDGGSGFADRAAAMRLEWMSGGKAPIELNQIWEAPSLAVDTLASLKMLSGIIHSLSLTYP